MPHTFDGPSAAASLIQGGQFRVLAKFDERPFPPAAQAPAIQTILPRLDPISVWLGLVAPKGTPGGIVDKLAREVANGGNSSTSTSGVSAISSCGTTAARRMRAPISPRPSGG